MSTDLTTSIVLTDGSACDVALRFCRTPAGFLRVYGLDGRFAPLFSEEDAIMLRDWLNDEWPVDRRDPELRKEVDAARRAAADWWARR